ncbi:glutamate synthase subunit beta [Gallaecimonas xiamenensis]|uniref:Glutamate synthase subunit beta n=1 Tax=Gallaecimonas xiamenensis 3-C-1 TaxID=745411 RepID=K2J3I2_9GAMM|nr:glutamate synthase subunit beta [Gallaecimonas xiamenensis]EKE69613.1 glutamate synthase subunit beta [Gallaecimonas xiamenensis 3-C-1]
MKDPLHYLSHPRQTGQVVPAAERVTQFKEVQAPQSESQRQDQSNRCLDCGTPYCQWKCPLHNAIPRWLDLASQGRVMDAAELAHQTNPLPEVCGRVCPQDRLCESVCTLNDEFGAVTIGQVERDITDLALDAGWRPDLSHVAKTGHKVAVIGAGPAGIGCADYLVRSGVAVTVYEAESVIGGLLTTGIPGFKLEKDIVQRRFEVLKDMGVEFVLGTKVGQDLAFKELLDNHDAVFLGLGAPRSVDSGLAGSDAQGSLEAAHYLYDQNLHLMQGTELHFNQQGKKVVVIGGGDTAMDCSRTALRQGADSVTLLYRRDRENMPGSPKEVRFAEEEGLHFAFCHQPLAILTEDGKVTGIRVQETRLGAPDASGRRRPEPVPGSERDLEADTVVLALGFRPQLPAWLSEVGVVADEGGRVLAPDGKTLHPKIFAGGDMVLGADLVVTAIANGRKAAAGILDKLGVTAGMTAA